MFRFLAKVCAKLAYRFKLEKEAATNDLNAGLSARLAHEKRALVEQLNKEADAIDARIKEVAAIEENGFYLCDDGHESDKPFLNGTDSFSCPFPMAEKLNGVCAKPAKLIKRSNMSGQEKYESDKERGEAEKIVQSKRDQAKAEIENAEGSEKTAQYFRGQAANGRTVADKVRAL